MKSSQEAFKSIRDKVQKALKQQGLTKGELHKYPEKIMEDYKAGN